MASALIGLRGFERIGPTTWLIQFEIEILGCAQATGDFSYRLIFQRPDQTVYVKERKSEPYTPAEGKHFIFDAREDVPVGDVVVGVDKIKSLLFRCEDRSRHLRLPYLDAFDPYDACKREANVAPRAISGAIGILFELAVVYSALKDGACAGDLSKFLDSSTKALDLTSRVRRYA